METTGAHSHAHHDHPDHGDHEHGHADWNDESFVKGWMEREKERGGERSRQFAIVRAVMPKTREQEFRYLNLGAGPGDLDDVLLQHFPGATATVLDGSFAMLAAARKQLERYGDRVEYVQANLDSADWPGAVSGPFDFVVSTLTIHHLSDARRIRELYVHAYALLGHGGMFLNLDFVRPSRPSLVALGPWAEKDPEAGLNGRGGDSSMPGTLLEHLGWLSEAGFPGVEVLWKDMNTVLLCGIRDHLHMPESADGHAHAHEGTHTHAHESSHAH